MGEQKCKCEVEKKISSKPIMPEVMPLIDAVSLTLPINLIIVCCMLPREVSALVSSLWDLQRSFFESSPH